ncbi:predicted protein [Histoplasma capsulatum G186AR]|uniref:Uncharacterized protein n=2 Tax=Ajellomyces capsulatus TaxID=5037 RepID=C0NJL1_AJECG|nr:uncharacterized protein HCBG_03341 [Histoplasma capsulatum G186AR]EEH08052.1 predicted protein [Histoplasma capsulatum G186AR]KAG5299623.1 hypothetical protein I7I52_09997 [Histoplasma capsulatum]QSS67751.1 no significant blast hit [Histoplasma capsulatum G186AR]
MPDFAVWGPIVSFLNLIHYINGLVGAQGEMRTADDIVGCTSDLLIGVKYDFEKLQDHLPRSRKRFTERQIDRTGREVKKAQKIISDNKDQNAGKRRINDICWVLKNKAKLQTCLTALLLYHVTLLQIRSELAFLESTMPWATDRFGVELRTFPNPRLRSPVDINSQPRALTWAKVDEFTNGIQYTPPISQSRQGFPPLSSLSYTSSPFTGSPRYYDPGDLGAWLLQQRYNTDRMRD